MIKLHTVQEVRAAGIVGTRKKCRQCGHYTELVLGTVASSFSRGLDYDPAAETIACQHCGALVSVDVRHDL